MTTGGGEHGLSNWDNVVDPNFDSIQAQASLLRWDAENVRANFGVHEYANGPIVPEEYVPEDPDDLVCNWTYDPRVNWFREAVHDVWVYYTRTQLAFLLGISRRKHLVRTACCCLCLGPLPFVLSAEEEEQLECVADDLDLMTSQTPEDAFPILGERWLSEEDRQLEREKAQQSGIAYDADVAAREEDMVQVFERFRTDCAAFDVQDLTLLAAAHRAGPRIFSMFLLSLRLYIMGHGFTNMQCADFVRIRHLRGLYPGGLSILSPDMHGRMLEQIRFASFALDQDRAIASFRSLFCCVSKLSLAEAEGLIDQVREKFSDDWSKTVQVSMLGGKVAEFFPDNIFGHFTCAHGDYGSEGGSDEDALVEDETLLHNGVHRIAARAGLLGLYPESCHSAMDFLQGFVRNVVEELVNQRQQEGGGEGSTNVANEVCEAEVANAVAAVKFRFTGEFLRGGLYPFSGNDLNADENLGILFIHEDDDDDDDDDYEDDEEEDMDEHNDDEEDDSVAVVAGTKRLRDEEDKELVDGVDNNDHDDVEFDDDMRDPDVGAREDEYFVEDADDMMWENNGCDKFNALVAERDVLAGALVRVAERAGASDAKRMCVLSPNGITQWVHEKVSNGEQERRYRFVSKALSESDDGDDDDFEHDPYFDDREFEVIGAEDAQENAYFGFSGDEDEDVLDLPDGLTEAQRLEIRRETERILRETKYSHAVQDYRAAVAKYTALESEAEIPSDTLLIDSESLLLDPPPFDGVETIAISGGGAWTLERAQVWFHGANPSRFVVTTSEVSNALVELLRKWGPNLVYLDVSCAPGLFDLIFHAVPNVTTLMLTAMTQVDHLPISVQRLSLHKTHLSNVMLGTVLTKSNLVALRLYQCELEDNAFSTVFPAANPSKLKLLTVPSRLRDDLEGFLPWVSSHSAIQVLTMQGFEGCADVFLRSLSSPHLVVLRIDHLHLLNDAKRELIYEKNPELAICSFHKRKTPVVSKDIIDRLSGFASFQSFYGSWFLMTDLRFE
jgi:hypothetical protein